MSVPPPSWVYVISTLDRRIKIGFTADPDRRLYALDRQHGGIGVEACVLGTRREERWLHRIWAHRSLGGDWFEWDDNLIAAAEEDRLFERPGGLTKFSAPWSEAA